jgi:Kdo2-lipid IVA lauroyltransferase/acyltransferase
MSRKREAFWYSIIMGTLRLLALIPKNIMTLCAWPLGLAWYAIDKNHRNIAVRNMTRAYKKELGNSEVKKLVKAVFIQFVRFVFEFPSLLKMTRNNYDTYVTFAGEENLFEAMGRKKGVLLLTAHLGHWEMMGTAMAVKYGLPLYAVARMFDFEAYNRVITDIRMRTGNVVLDKDKGAAKISSLLRRNQIVGIMLDQNSSWYEGVYVPFFDRLTCTNKGLAMFAMRYGATVLPVFNIRQDDGRYRIIFDKPVDIKRTNNVGQDIIDNTIHFNKIIEKYVRMAPDNWLWVHRRWRIKPVPERARHKIKGVIDADFFS